MELRWGVGGDFKAGNRYHARQMYFHFTLVYMQYCLFMMFISGLHLFKYLLVNTHYFTCIGNGVVLHVF